MRVRLMALALSVAGASAGGCDWRALDDLKAQTPVLSVGAPSGYGESQSFGQFTLAVAPPIDGSAAARFVASAGTRPRLAVVSLDAAGQPHGQNIDSPVLDALDANNMAPITALAEVPGARVALLGAPTANPAQLLTLGLDDPYTVTSFISSPEPDLGIGVAAYNLGGGAAADYVAVSATGLHVYVDGSAAADLVHVDEGAGDPCPIALSNAVPAHDRVNRAVVVGKLLASGVQIAVGTPAAGGPGTVSIFTVDVATGTFTCALTLTPSTGSPADPLFGRALAIADFNNDNQPDLLVGSPPDAVYLFLGPLTGTPTRVISNPTPPGDSGQDFGKAVAGFDLDGSPGAEAVIGFPSATFNGQVGAGTVHVYSGPTLTMQPLGPALGLHDPKSGDGYGTTVAGLPFCAVPAGADGGTGGPLACHTLPMIGSGAKVFTYFTLGPTDPRSP